MEKGKRPQREPNTREKQKEVKVAITKEGNQQMLKTLTKEKTKVGGKMVETWDKKEGPR